MLIVWQAIIWALSGIALIFLAARLAIRLKVYGRLMVDDGLVILAIICLVVSDIINTTFLSKTFIVQDVKIFHHTKPPHYQAVADAYAKYQWADAYLFFTSIWAVKGSFLAYYDDLTKRLTTFRRFWWAAIVFTILTYIGSLFAYAFLDGVQFKETLKNEAIKYQFAADLSTDVISMLKNYLLLQFRDLELTYEYQVTIIPLTVALRSQIPPRQKLALVGIFSLSLIVTVFSIIRFILNSPSRGTAGPSWLQAWSTIEQSVSVIVACLASFRVLAIHKRRKSKQSSSDGRMKSIKKGFSILRSPWSTSSTEPRRAESMDIQLLDVPSSRNPTEETTSSTHRVISNSP